MPPTMLPSRPAQRHLRSVARPTLTLALSRFPPILTAQHRRPLTTETVSQREAQSIITAQRKNRPISPHLSIYKPQITWYGSALNRITGAVLSSGIYCFGAAYLVAPALGWHLDVASMAAAFGSLPVVAKAGLKTAVALPFTYHSINGVRHLVWDTGAALSKKQVIRTGWAVVGLSAVSAMALAML